MNTFVAVYTGNSKLKKFIPGKAYTIDREPEIIPMLERESPNSIPVIQLKVYGVYDEILHPRTIGYRSLEDFIKDWNVNLNAKHKLITLCGSTRFKNEFMYAAKELTRQNYIVLNLSFFAKSDPEDMKDRPKQEDLISVHTHRMSISDAIFVIDPNRYVGGDTQREINWCKANGVKIFYLHDHPKCIIKPEEWED